MPLLLRLSLIVAYCLSLSAIAAPVAPSDCVAAGMATNEAATVAISWRDNSTDEIAWSVEYSVNGGASFIRIGLYGTTNQPGTGGTQAIVVNALSNTHYLFRVKASNGAAFSAYSNVASATTAPFSTTATVAASQNATEVAATLAWPEIPNASSYRILKGSTPANVTLFRTVAAGSTGTRVSYPDIMAGNTYYFKVQPMLGSFAVGTSDPAGVAVNIITSKTGTSGTPGSAFLHSFTQTTVTSTTVSSRSLTYNGQPALPGGLSFNSSTGVLGGVYPAIGNYTLVYRANLSDGTSLTQSFSIRVRPAAGAPSVTEAIPAWTGDAGTSRDTDLTVSFSDPEAESAVRVSTTLGDMDFILFDSATPATVANFMNYVVSGRYTNVAFHRSISDFVIQGGGFAGTGSGSNFTSVITNPPVVNEPGIANERGTISMAKLGGDPDSATSQFFVSTGDNRSNLDYQNGGFTVFGRVAGDGMEVVDAINDLPTSTYHLFVDGSSGTSAFTNFPMNASSAPGSMDQSKLVKINSVTPVPTMSFSISGNTNPTVATASVADGQLHIDGLSGGHTTITVTATDLDNLTTTQEVEVNLKETYAAWASRNELPDDQNEVSQNPDGDRFNNLLEYAFLEDPAEPTQGPLPAAAKIGIPPADEFMTLTFPVRKFTGDLNYIVEGTDAPGGAWSAVWTSADGFGHPQVLEAVDLADRTAVKIQDTVAIGAQLKRFLRVRIVQE